MSSRIFSGLLLSLLAAVGCGSSQQETAPTRGTVKFQGKPLEFGIVMFQPDVGWPASGKIQPDGSFVLETYKPGDGAIVGENRARVSCTEQHRPNAETAAPATGEAAVQPSLIPAKYDNLDTSGLRYTVKAGEPNVFAIELE